MSCAMGKFRAWDANHEDNSRSESKSIVPETEYQAYCGKQSAKKKDRDILL